MTSNITPEITLRIPLLALNTLIEAMTMYIDFVKSDPTVTPQDYRMYDIIRELLEETLKAHR